MLTFVILDRSRYWTPRLLIGHIMWRSQNQNILQRWADNMFKKLKFFSYKII
jgi:hypothetical protein